MIDDTPTPNDVPVIAEVTAPEYTHTTSEVTELRSQGCRECSYFIFDGVTKCSKLGLDINLIISVNEISCPEDVW